MSPAKGMENPGTERIGIGPQCHPKPAAAKTSWWVGVSREEFRDVAQAANARMNQHSGTVYRSANDTAD